MEEVKIHTEYIKLDQFLKLAGEVENGGSAKGLIFEGLVKVNNNVELQRGKKLRPGDIIELKDKKYVITA